MPEMSREQAVQRLVRELPSLRSDDLAEVYNELFPTEPTTEELARRDRSRLLDRINDHFSRGLEPEEIGDLWNVLFPRERHVSYDEESDTIHYGEKAGFVHDDD
jgi:hypothetical protein